MLITEIIDLIQSDPEGAQSVNVNRWDDDFLINLIDLGRAAWAIESYMKDKRLEPILYQKFYPKYSLPLQPTDKCYAKFLMPDIIRLDEHSDGIRYVGEDDYNGGGVNNFRRVVSRAWLSTFNNHPVMNTNRAYSFLYDGSSGILELRGKATPVKEPLVEALFKHPLQIPTFDRDANDYPLTLDGINAVKNMILTSDARLVENTNPKAAFTQGAQMPK